MVTAEELGYRAGQAEVFVGSYCEVMQKLRNAGFRPLSPAGIMDLRTQSNNPDSPAWSNYFDTDTGLYATRTEVGILPRCRLLTELTSDTKLTNYGVRLSNVSPPLEFQRFDRSELVLNKSLTEEQALAHKGWLALADNDQDRLARYVEATFRLGKDRSSRNEMMGFYVPEDEEPIVRGVVVDRLHDRSSAICDRYLDADIARFVGVRDAVAQKNLEASDSKVLEALKSGRAFKYSGVVYVPLANGVNVRLE